MASGQFTRVEETVSQIRAQIAAGANGELNEPAPALSSDSRTPQVQIDLFDYRAQIQQSASVLGLLDDKIAQSVEAIGTSPPSPPTTRGRIGAVLIQILSKLFWWQTLQIKESVRMIVLRNREQVSAFEKAHQILSDAVSESLLIGANFNRLGANFNRLEANSNRLEANFNRLEADFITCRSELQLLGVMGERVTSLSSALQNLEQEIGRLQARITRQEEQRLPQEALVEQLRMQLDTALQKLSDLGLAAQKLRGEVSVQQGKMSQLLREVRKGLRSSTDTVSAESVLQQTGLGLDRVYLDFEDVFRGPRSEIKERQRKYLSDLHQVGAGTRDKPVADLGCGRGEWLELLRDEGLEARGVDKNRAMLDLCRDLGLNVFESDALSYLRSLQDGSLGAITSFHMIEHMQFEDVIALMDETLRVLRTGGLLILETPNPGNLAVGASNFHLDPTHVRPIPHQTLQFFAEARGFCDVRIRELHPYPEMVRLPEEQAYGRRFNECFYGPQDYCLIAYKPR